MNSVPHYTPDTVMQIEAAAAKLGRHGERDALMIRVMFDASLRISEVLGLTPIAIQWDDDSAVLHIAKAKGGKPRQAGISPSKAGALQDYARRHSLGDYDRFFNITRHHAHYVISRATRAAGVLVPPGVGATHVLRHAGAIQLYRKTGDLKLVQDQLGHSSPLMTMRYQKTVQQQDSVERRGKIELTC